MLRRLTIRNFRSVVEGRLDFGRLNLFIGPNGGGKSNVLEAIGIVSAALGRGIAPRDLDDRGVRLSLPMLFKASFKNRKIPREFQLEAETEHCSYRISVLAGEESETLAIQTERLIENGQKFIGRNIGGKEKLFDDPVLLEASQRAAREPTRSSYDTLKTLLPLSDQGRTELDTLAGYSIYAPQTAVLRGQAQDSRQASPLGLSGGGLAAALTDVLRHAGPKQDDLIQMLISLIFATGWVDLVKPGPPDPAILPREAPVLKNVVYFRDRFMAKQRSFLSPYDASEGALYLLFIGVLLAHPEAPRIFALDNVDGTLNPAMIRMLVRTIRSVLERDGTRQIFMTSHNPAALDELDLFDPDHRAFVVWRNKDGRTEFSPLRPNPGMTREEWDARYGSRNLSALWVDGDIPHALGTEND